VACSKPRETRFRVLTELRRSSTTAVGEAQIWPCVSTTDEIINEDA